MEPETCLNWKKTRADEWGSHNPIYDSIKELLKENKKNENAEN